MMNKLKTGKAWRWKVATFLPVLALLLMAFGRTGENVPPEKENLPVNSLTEINQNQNEQKSRLIEVRKDGNYIDNKLYSLEEVVKKGKEWGKANNDWIQLRIDESVPYSRTDEILEQLSPGMYHITLSKVNSDEIVYFAGDVSQSAKFTQGKREDWMKARLNQIIGDKFSRYNIDYSFIVDRTGKVIDAHIVKPSEYSEVNSAYEKILTQMPNWEPAKRMGKSVSVYYVMRVGSIRFTPPKIKPNESQNSTTSGNSTDEVTANFTLGKEAYLKGSKFSQLNDSLLKMQKKGAADYKDSVAVRDSMNFWYKKANSSFAVVTRLTPDFAGGFLWKGRMANYLDLKAEKTEAKEAYEKALTILEKDVNKNKRSIIECYRYLAWYNFNNSERVSKFDKQQSDQYKNAAKDYYLKISALDPNDKQTKVIIEKLSKK